MRKFKKPNLEEIKNKLEPTGVLNLDLYHKFVTKHAIYQLTHLPNNIVEP